MQLQRLHRLNALFLGSYIIIHLVTHLTALGGVETYHQVQSWVRLLYRNPVIEPILILSVITQVLAGIRLAVRRWPEPNKEFWSWAQIISGLFLSYFLTVHTSAAMYTRFVAGLETNFYWPGGTLSYGNLAWGFAPYYTAAITALFVHIAAALYFRYGSTRAPHALTLGGAAFGALITATFAGAFFQFTLPDDYVAFYRALSG